MMNTRPRRLALVLASVVLGSFVFASCSLKLAVDERNRSITQNRQRTEENKEQIMRACERINAVVAEIIQHTAIGEQLRLRLRKIDRDYPRLEPCFR